MSRTKRGDPGPTKDWWGKRPLAGYVSHSHRPGRVKVYKRLLHKIERRQGKEAKQEEL